MGMFEHFPYTNFHDLNLDWLLKKTKELEESLKELWVQFLKSRVPVGGLRGQYLRKTSDDDYAMEWQDASGLLPSGGSTGQVLKKTSDADYEVGWQDESGGGAYLPLAGGTMDTEAAITMQDKNGNPTVMGAEGIYAPNNYTISAEQDVIFTKTPKAYTEPVDDNDLMRKQDVHNIPAGGSAGQVLKKTSDADYEIGWHDESGGGGEAYLPLAGGIMDAGAAITMQDTSGNSTVMDAEGISAPNNYTISAGQDVIFTKTPKAYGYPTENEDLATKQYVDEQSGGGGGSSFVKSKIWSIGTIAGHQAMTKTLDGLYDFITSVRDAGYTYVLCELLATDMAERDILFPANKYCATNGYPTARIQLYSMQASSSTDDATVHFCNGGYLDIDFSTGNAGHTAQAASSYNYQIYNTYLRITAIDYPN